MSKRWLMGRLKQAVEEYNRQNELYKKTPEYRKNILVSEMKRLEYIVKIGLVEEKEIERLRNIWRACKKELDKLK